MKYEDLRSQATGGAGWQEAQEHVPWESTAGAALELRQVSPGAWLLPSSREALAWAGGLCSSSRIPFQGALVAQGQFAKEADPCTCFPGSAIGGSRPGQSHSRQSQAELPLHKM